MLKVNVSVPNTRLFVGNIPKSKGHDEILDEFGKLAGKKKNSLAGKNLLGEIELSESVRWRKSAKIAD